MPSGPLTRTRRALAQAVRTRVAGENFQAVHDRIWNAPGERWFGADDPIWRVHGDTSMFIGGIRALLLQSLHPVAMQAVSEHSGYRGDPWGRLQRTSHFIATTTMGTIADAERAIATVRRVHEFVRGVTPTGEPYVATDPHLLRWVHLAEIDSFLAAHQAYGARPLTATEADVYVEQTALVAEKLGAVDVPRTTAQLEQALTAYRLELVRTPAAVEAAELLLHDPPLPPWSRPAYRTLAAGAVALLPPWALTRLRLPHQPVTGALVARPLAGAAMRTLRWALASGSAPSDPAVQAG